MDELIDQGGPVVWPLLVLAVAGLYFSVERFIYFQRSRIVVTDLLIGLRAHLERGDLTEARSQAGRAGGPVGRICEAVLVRPDLPRSDLRDVAQEAGRLEIPRLERNLRGILGAAMLAPLLGLLGTALGLANTFLRMRESGDVATSADLSLGIFQALLTTALGLTIAIPLYVFYLYFYARIRRLLARMERVGIEIVNLVEDHRMAIKRSAKAEQAPKETAAR